MIVLNLDLKKSFYFWIKEMSLFAFISTRNNSKSI